MFLQGVHSVYEIDFDGLHTYGEIYLHNEIEQCIYNYELADVDGLRRAYDFYESEAKAALTHTPPLVMPAHDYVLKCSHTFNLLDSRGAIGVTERANYFRRMRELSRQVAAAYVEQRKAMEYPWLKESGQLSAVSHQPAASRQPPTATIKNQLHSCSRSAAKNCPRLMSPQPWRNCANSRRRC